jgi:U2-associated protein SR140
MFNPFSVRPGELYSVKIMYPRTAEERSRNRHSGFVCFCFRQDAQDAITACNERDVFSKGHRLQMNWGRRVEMHGRGQPAVASFSSRNASSGNHQLTVSSQFDPNIDGNTAIRVQAPSDPQRWQLISTVASFVAKDGYQLEQYLIKKHQSNLARELDFLVHILPSLNHRNHDEHIFYKWRVYSFAQGDSWHIWRTDPFQLIRGGSYWIPPPLELDAARREQEAKRAEQQELDTQKQQRRLRSRQLNLLTGSQIEQSHFNNSNKLSQDDLREFYRLTRDELCCSRESISQAMSFCYEKSAAADQVSSLLKDLMLERCIDDKDMDLVTARLFLLSDVLFNSQQPGVKNAFRYRDSIERMAPDVFDALYTYGQGLGRMTLSKLARVIRNVLLAWKEWEVFHTPFLDELRARFDGREIVAPPAEIGDHEDADQQCKKCGEQIYEGDLAPSSSRSVATFQSVEHEAGGGRTFDEIEYEDEMDGVPLDEDFDCTGEITIASSAMLLDTQDVDSIDGELLEDDIEVAEHSGKDVDAKYTDGQ